MHNFTTTPNFNYKKNQADNAWFFELMSHL